MGNCCGGTGGGARAGENETRYVYRRRFGNALARDLQHLFLNEWIAHPLGEFFAFARPWRGTRRPGFAPQDGPQKPRRGVAPRIWLGAPQPEKNIGCIS